MTSHSDADRHQLIGLAVFALGVVLLVVAFTGHVPLLGGSGGKTVNARFAQANEVNDSTPVRIGGVDVGHVDALRRAPGNTTTIAMSITTGGVRLHADAAAQIRWRTLLGGSMYIELDPGSPSAPALTGEIPLSRTGSQVDWDQLGAQLPTVARRRLRQQFRGLDATLQAPRGEGQTLHVLGPATTTIGRGSAALRGEQNGDLTRLVRTTATTLQALGAGNDELRRLVDGADQTLAVTASHNAELARTVELSPPALDATLMSSRILNQTLTALDPLVVRLQPGARLLAPTTTVLHPLLARTVRTLTDAQPLLHAAPGALRSLADASEQGVSLIAAVIPIVNRLNGNLIPFLGRTDPDTRLKLYEAIGPVASALSSSQSGFDAGGHVYNFNVQFSTGSLLLPCDAGATGATNLATCLTHVDPLQRKVP